jgi:Tfp pilus assembly protein PilO
VNRRAPIIAAAVVLVVAVLAFLLLVYPKFGQIREAEEDLGRARAQHAALEAELSRLQAAAEDLPRLQRQLARFRRAVPPVADLPGLINELQSAADVAAVDFFAISPTEPTASPVAQAAEIAASIQVIGTFFPVDEFLFRLESLARAAKVTNVDLNEGPDGLPQIDVNLRVVFFTTDPDAGPGAPVVAPTPEASPSPEASPGASPSPTATPTEEA